MDSSQMLPLSTIISMWVGLVLTLLLPLATVVFFGIKKRGSVFASVMGIVSYGVSLCIYGLLWCIYVALFSNGYNTVGLTWDFYLVLAVLSGITGALFNYLFLKKLNKKRNTPATGFSFLAGYTMVICYQSAYTLIKDLYWAMKYNGSQGLESLTAGMSSSKAAQVTDQLYNISMYGTMYLLKVLETVLYLAGYLAIGYLLYQAVKKEKKWHMAALPLAMVLQFGMVLPGQLIKSEIIDVAAMELILGFATAFALILAGIVYMKQRRNREEV